MGLDAQKSFAYMHEDGNMDKGIWGQMMQLDPVVVQESRKEKREKETPILVPSMRWKQRFPLYFHTDDLNPRQDTIGQQIWELKDPATPENLSQIENTYLCSNPHHGLALQPHPFPWSFSWGPSGNLQISSRAYTGGNPRAIVGRKGKQKLWIWELENEKTDLKQ